MLGFFLWPLISSHEVGLWLEPVLQKLDFGIREFLQKIKENHGNCDTCQYVKCSVSYVGKQQTNCDSRILTKYKNPHNLFCFCSRLPNQHLLCTGLKLCSSLQSGESCRLRLRKRTSSRTSPPCFQRLAHHLISIQLRFCGTTGSTRSLLIFTTHDPHQHQTSAVPNWIQTSSSLSASLKSLRIVSFISSPWTWTVHL